ncbi:MAG: glucose 1-dehydrogenase [Chloroflexota bacterium]|nr:glucose 1-dehydrogenase [Chloroflexota bacterium]
MSARSVSGVAVTPGVPHSLHMTEIPLPEVGPGQVEIHVLEAGICGTDREIIEAKFGSAPKDSRDLVIGHEVLGEVAAAGDGVSGLSVGDLVTVTVRRGCGCPQCEAGASDFCTRMAFTERGIIGRHGFMTERFVEDVEHVIPVPATLREIGVLIEPTSVAEKAWRVLDAVQARIAAWTPRTAIVFGAGPIGLLQTFVLRARGIDVWTVARRPAEASEASELVTACGATYLSTVETDLAGLGSTIGNVDIIVECSGSSEAVQRALPLLGVGGVLVLLSVTGGTRTAELPLDRLNFEFVSGNKTMVGSVNSNRGDFERAIADLQEFERLWPGLASRMITHRLPTLADAVDLMESTRGAIKAIVAPG